MLNNSLPGVLNKFDNLTIYLHYSRQTESGTIELFFMNENLVFNKWIHVCFVNEKTSDGVDITAYASGEVVGSKHTYMRK